MHLDKDQLVRDLLVDLDAPRRGHRPPQGFVPRGDEEVRLVLQDVTLLELRTDVLPLSGGQDLLDLDVEDALLLAEETPRARSIAIGGRVAVRDDGMAVVTDQRLVFLGDAWRREWAYAEVQHAAHDRAVPESWLHVPGRARTSGLRYAGADALELRGELALAVAAVRGEQSRLRARLTAQLPAAGQPQPGGRSVAARLRSAVAFVYLGKPGARPAFRVGQGVVAALATAAVIGSAVGGSGGTSELAVTSADSTSTVVTAAPSREVPVGGVEEAAAEQAAAQQAADRAAAEQAAAAQAAAAASKAEADRVAATKAAVDRAAADRAAADRAAADRAAADEAARAKAERDAAAATRPAAGPAAGAGCEPSYPDFCIPSGPDVDCPDLSHKRFTALAPDPFRLDADHDGIACES